MSREILFKAKRTDNGEWVEGDLIQDRAEKRFAISNESGLFEVAGYSICQYTGLADRTKWEELSKKEQQQFLSEWNYKENRKNKKEDWKGKKIWENDITRLILPDGEVRYFKVSIKSVVRKVVSHPDFDDATAKVEIIGVVFEWNGYELFPCTDTYGVPDYKMMEIVGNIFDNPELLEQED